MEKDLLIIGGGPGGYVAAIRAAQLGAKVLLVEQQALGGTCLHQGCIPTKALYKNAEVMNTLKKADEFGIRLKEYSLSMKIVQSRKQEVIQCLHKGIIQLMKIHGVPVKYGQGRLLDSSTVEITDFSGHQEKISAQHILIATGSKASNIPIAGANLPGVLTSAEVLELEEIPQQMIIIGGGVIGLEFAGIFQAFGAQVTVLELLPRILPLMDEELIKRMIPLLKKRGIRIETGVRVQEIKQTSDSLTVLAKDKKDSPVEYNTDLVLIATGRSPHTECLGLDEVGVKYDRTGIEVDRRFATSVSGVHAVGDVIGGQMLAHVASYQGRVLAENLFRSPVCSSAVFSTAASAVFPVVPSCVFSFPEVASVGLTEEEVNKQGIPYLVSKSMFGANGKALTMGEGEGLLKVLAKKEDKQILGVHILGPHASDLIHEAALAIRQNLTAKDIAPMIHAHPTLAETFHEAILGF
jgi:dihydrolipoamide dehydrogenase